MTEPLKKRNPASGPGFAEQQTKGRGLQEKYIGAPIELLLSRLDGPRKAGKGWACKCPAHAERNASLSIAEGQDGRVLLRCFAGCEPLAIVHALGLELRDLFPQRLPDLTREGRAEARLVWKQAGWAAALNVVAREATVTLIAARMVASGGSLNGEDSHRLSLAVDRIEGARGVLT